MIDISTAGRILDFATRIGAGQRADAQLQGAVAIHNRLESQGVAYLADEVGMGKTYVALGALALFRHYQPDFRLLVIAPRENIQKKWMKELRNFVAHNVRFPDLRVKSVDGRAARPLIACDNLLELVRESTLDPDRDFFLRLTSFSLAMPWQDDGGRKEARRLRDGLRRHLPWMKNKVFDLRDKAGFKDNFARALCCSLRPYDLVIVDEAHNLKHGFGTDVASRNRVLGLMMGHPDGAADPRLFPGYGPRARRVLFLSATPVEEHYGHLWNQLDIFGKAAPYQALVAPDASDAHKRDTAARFLIRRVTEIRVAGTALTKNQYRREWRRGGLAIHDEPIQVVDPKQRLIVALIQKKVAELLGEERFKSSFQVGMLASFESFLETAKLKVDDEANFDHSDQTDDAIEKEGIDVHDINRLAKSYRATFGREMPHPKMDALVGSLEDTWRGGAKALVFVRRVASVTELKKKLAERYDAWLADRLKRGIPERLHKRLNVIWRRYRREQEKIEARSRRLQAANRARRRARNDADTGGHETFFAWFFRGDGPRGVVSGATIQQRLGALGGSYGTFFKDNHAAALLNCKPGEAMPTLVNLLGLPEESIRADLRIRSRQYLTRATKLPRGKRFEAVQAAAIRLLAEHPASPPDLRDRARVVWEEWFRDASQLPMHQPAEPPEIGDFLETTTFFTALRERPALRDAIWPCVEHPDFRLAFREQELRANLLATASRLGHSLIDLYTLAICRLGSLTTGAQEEDEDEIRGDHGLAKDYLDLLETQMNCPRMSRDWGAYDELAEIAGHFDLILDVNEPQVREAPLRQASVLFGRLLREQQPIGGMAGQVNQTLVRQFRMPGYPFVLVTTDVLQEGEDLHTFCSAVHHYGIAWTPSSMEQRTGRVDRVRSATDRRLSRLDHRPPSGDERLQVFFPHLEDTVEVLQVERVLERMNVFLTLMHEGLTVPRQEQRTINAAHEFAKGRRGVPQITESLRTAFPIRASDLAADPQPLAADEHTAATLLGRFERLANESLPGVDIVWEPRATPGQLTGTARLHPRTQPFKLMLTSHNSWPAIRCISPVGCVDPEANAESLVQFNRILPAKIVALPTDEARSYDLTVESEVLLAPTADSDAGRAGLLIDRVTRQADRLEREQLPGADQPLSRFEHDLAQESVDDE
jgi:hypothetical protein